MRKLLSLIVSFLMLVSPVTAQHTYYVSTSGSDANTSVQAQSTSTPWARVPGMADAAGNSAAYTVVAGDIFVLKRGDTWPYTIWPWNARSGTSSTTTKGCTGTGCVTYTSNSSFGDATNCSNAGYTSVANCRAVVSGGGWLVVNTSCNYDQNNAALTQMFRGAAKQYWILDNIEFTGMCSSTGKAPTFGNGTYIYVGNTSDLHFTLSNLYFHGVVFLNTCASNPGAGTAPCGDFWAAVTGVTTCTVADTGVFGPNNWVEGTDATNANNGQGWYSGKGVYGSPNTILQSEFKNISQALDPSCWDTIAYNGFDNASAQSISYLTSGGGTHPHIINASGGPFNTQYYEYNNRHVTVFSGQWAQAAPGNSAANRFVFNEVATDMTVSTTWNGDANFFNNTIEAGADSGTPANNAYICSGGSACIIRNAHSVTAASPIYGGTPSSTSNLVSQTKLVASGQGYTFAQSPYQFYPTAGGSTIGTGTNLATLCGTITDATASAACLQDTAYGTAVDTSNHRVTGLAHTPVNRGTTWDVGAYQFSGTPPPSNPPFVISAYPLPAPVVQPTITKVSPTNTYVTTNGCSQDGQKFVNPCPFRVFCSNCSQQTHLFLDGVAVSQTYTTGEMDANVPLSLLAPPTVITQHSFTATNPSPSIPILTGTYE
jgi:hypothetical protein